MISISAVLLCWLSYKAGQEVPVGSIWLVAVLADLFIASIWITNNA